MGNRPLEKFTAGTVVGSIWENEVPVPTGGTRTMLKVQLERRYKDRYGEWKSTTHFGRNEIPLAQYVLQKAFEFILNEKTVRGGTGEID